MTTQGSVAMQSHRTWGGMGFSGSGVAGGRGGSECLRFLRTKLKTAVVLDTVKKRTAVL